MLHPLFLGGQAIIYEASIWYFLMIRLDLSWLTKQLAVGPEPLLVIVDLAEHRLGLLWQLSGGSNWDLCRMSKFFDWSFCLLTCWRLKSNQQWIYIENDSFNSIELVMKVLEPFQAEVYRSFPFGCLNMKAPPKFPKTWPTILEVFFFLFPIFLHFLLEGVITLLILCFLKKNVIFHPFPFPKTAPKRHYLVFFGD